MKKLLTLFALTFSCVSAFCQLGAGPILSGGGANSSTTTSIIQSFLPELIVATNGNDSTGLPFLTISNAASVAIPGQLIRVTSGWYTNSRIPLKEGVAFYFEPNSFLVKDDSVGSELFYADHFVTNMLITGCGTFLPESAVVNFVTVSSTNTTLNINVTAKRIGNPTVIPSFSLVGALSFNRAKWNVDEMYYVRAQGGGITNLTSQSDFYNVNPFHIVAHSDSSRMKGTNRFWNCYMRGDELDHGGFGDAFFYGGDWDDGGVPLDSFGGNYFWHGTRISAASTFPWVDDGLGSQTTTNWGNWVISGDNYFQFEMIGNARQLTNYFRYGNITRSAASAASETYTGTGLFITLTNYQRSDVAGFNANNALGSLTNLTAGKYAISFTINLVDTGNLVYTNAIFTNGVLAGSYVVSDANSALLTGFNISASSAPQVMFLPANCRTDLRIRAGIGTYSINHATLDIVRRD